MNLLEEQIEYVLPILAVSELQRLGITPTAVRMVVVKTGCAVLIHDLPVFGVKMEDMSEARLQSAVDAWKALDPTTRGVVYGKRWDPNHSMALVSILAQVGMLAQQPVGNA